MVVLLFYLEADLHGCLSNGQIGTPDVVQGHMLVLQGPHKLLGLVLEADGVDIQGPVQEVDCLLCQACREQCCLVNAKGRQSL